nr:MAG TPA: hypothetical protein [Caudoviricetes sp.]
MVSSSDLFSCVSVLFLLPTKEEGGVRHDRCT